MKRENGKRGKERKLQRGDILLRRMRKGQRNVKHEVCQKKGRDKTERQRKRYMVKCRWIERVWQRV